MSMLVCAAGLSDRGSARDGNDDHFCIGPVVEQTGAVKLEVETTGSWFREYGLLLAVADGIGGYAGGASASRLVLETLTRRYYAERRAGATAAALAASISGYLVEANAALGAFCRSSSAAAGSGEPGAAAGIDSADAGTTIAGLALLAPDVLTVFHVGDSRVLRASAGYLTPLTMDHTPAAAAMARTGLDEREAAARRDAGMLTRSFGLRSDATVEIGYSKDWSRDDAFLLCTDGLHGLGRGLGHDRLQESLAGGGGSHEIVVRLVADAVASDGSDNATAVFVSFRSADVPTGTA
jgi:protein phosphatase